MMGETISHYVIREKLGEGGMGVVYKAVDTKLDRTVALKFLAPHLLRNDDARRRFEQEAKTAASLNHPNICTLYEIDEADGHTFLALEYIDGEGLDEIASRGPLPAAQAADYAAQAARGLAAAHAKGIVHRDIKGGNIMVTADGLVKVMDFGLARLTSDSRLTQDGTVLGTPAYMAPEQLEGLDVDARADVWAFGVVLYEMLAGRLPFEAEYHQALLYAVMHEQPEPLADAPEELAAIVAKALEKDLSARYADAAEMGAAIEAFVDAERSSAATFPPLKQAGGEWTSKQRLFGLPLVHIATGFDPLTGRARIAKGIIAIGGIAVGGFAVGGISLGAFAIGGIAAGITSVGGVALALWMAFGAVTVGMDPQGVVAIGPEGTRVMEAVVEQAASTEEQSEPPSVAVMPFVNSSGDPDFEYFSDGMTDELINALSKIKGLKVVGRSSVFRFKGQQYDSAEIGERLQVHALLEGTVRKAGNRLRITAQLINAADGFEIWSERYDAEMKDVFDVQDEISRAMVGALSSELLGGSAEPIVRQSTENPEAYRLYLQGNRWFDLSESGLRQNIEYLEQALAIDPDFPRARAALARMLSFLSTLGFERPADTLERSRREALQALRSDETVAEAHTALAEILFYDDWDFVGAEQSLRRAVELNPANPDTRQSLGTFLASQGRFAEALSELRLALQLDPLSARGNLLLCYVLNYAGDFEAALIQAKRTLEIDPRLHFAYVHRSDAYLGLQRPKDALQAVQTALAKDSSPAILGNLGMAQAAVGREADARATIDKLIQARAEGYSPALPVAEIYAHLGDLDQAFTWLNRAVEQREPLLTQLKHFPVRYDALRGDPRYDAILRRIGFRE